MKKIWLERGWNDYLLWQETDKKILKKINKLIKDIERNGNSGLGKPEPLKNHDGYWSRRIDDKNRLVYKIVDADTLYIAQCKDHYEEK